VYYNYNLYFKLRTIIRGFVQYYVTLLCCTYRSGWFRHRSLHPPRLRVSSYMRTTISIRERPPAVTRRRRRHPPKRLWVNDDSGVQGCVATVRKSVNGRREAGGACLYRSRAHPELGIFIRRRRQ